MLRAWDRAKDCSDSCFGFRNATEIELTRTSPPKPWKRSEPKLLSLKRIFQMPRLRVRGCGSYDPWVLEAILQKRSQGEGRGGPYSSFTRTFWTEICVDGVPSAHAATPLAFFPAPSTLALLGLGSKLGKAISVWLIRLLCPTCLYTHTHLHGNTELTPQHTQASIRHVHCKSEGQDGRAQQVISKGHETHRTCTFTSPPFYAVMPRHQRKIEETTCASSFALQDCTEKQHSVDSKPLPLPDS